MQKLAAISIMPLFGWFLSALMAILMAIPLWVLWSWLAPIYFPFLPALYLNIPFLHLAGMLVLIGFIKLVVYPSNLNRVN